MKQVSALTQAKEACNELIRDYETRMYMSSYAEECYAKLKVIRRGLNSAVSRKRPA